MAGKQNPEPALETQSVTRTKHRDSRTKGERERDGESGA